MRHMKMPVFNDFSCIGSDCPLTCCGRWEIDIDKNTLEYYNNVKGEFGKRLKENIAQNESGEYHFALRDNGLCQLLNDKGLCDIYINLGQEHLCATCTQYPRYSYIAGDIRFSGLYMSCPEVGRLLLSSEDPLIIDLSEDEQKVRDADTIDRDLLEQSLDIFVSSVDIAQNRSFKVRERVALLILFCVQFQACVDQNRDASGMISVFSNPEYFSELLNGIIISDNNLQLKLEFCFEFIKSLLRVSRLDVKAPVLYDLLKKYRNLEDVDINEEKIRSACRFLDEPGEQVWQEQLVVYGLNHYFMQKFGKRQFYDSFIFGCTVTYLLIISAEMLYYFLCDELPDKNWIVQTVTQISRVTEHGLQLEDDFFKAYREKGMISTDFILQFLSH